MEINFVGQEGFHHFLSIIVTKGFVHVYAGYYCHRSGVFIIASNHPLTLPEFYGQKMGKKEFFS